ncbi:serine hydrolase [Bradyrhizobium sp. AS23.2]|uniref:serine hydrolase domain-containing protein n=1 Tax=Bradyrhizobium sp. AS23.2 TaxID=1680155 RepID=UPI000A6CA216|nr:serine hydrolase [Bradyrhizobium sp. AS23.2]
MNTGAVRVTIIAMAMLAASGITSAQEAAKLSAAGPVFSNTGYDANAYGANEGYPLGTLAVGAEMRHLVATYSHFDELTPAHIVGRAAAAWSFQRAAEPEIYYSFRGERRTIADYLSRQPTTGLLLARDDTILYEHYQYARSAGDRFLSQSMAKTITAMLIGIAAADGLIKSIDDDVATYVTALAGTEYGKTPIRALLHMSSGVDFKEIYDGQDDIARLGRDLFGRPGKAPEVSIAQFNTRVAPPDTRWHYASSETEILGLVLRAATGKPVADYLSEKIWQRIGTEADASWAIDGTGQEVTFCCFNAVLRDYARFGRLLAHDGMWNGREIISRQWLIDATTVRSSDTYLAPGVATKYYGYGYQVWLLPGAKRQFVLLGIRGQMIFVDPATKLVMVHTAVRPKAVDTDASAETIALWLAVVDQLGRGAR